jgi:hypothetical protein
MEAIKNEEFFKKLETLIIVEFAIIIIACNVLLLFNRIGENHYMNLTLKESIGIAILNLILILMQAVFSAMQWESKIHRFVAKIAIWELILSFPIMLLSTIKII